MGTLEQRKSTGNESFQIFLERQEAHKVRKEIKVAAVKQEIDGPYKPSINRKSLSLAEKKGSFLERLEEQAKVKQFKVKLVLVPFLEF